MDFAVRAEVRCGLGIFGADLFAREDQVNGPPGGRLFYLHQHVEARDMTVLEAEGLGRA